MFRGNFNPVLKGKNGRFPPLAIRLEDLNDAADDPPVTPAPLALRVLGKNAA